MKFDMLVPRNLVFLLACAFLSFLPVAGHGQSPPRPLAQAEIESLLAPIALYPDGVVTEVLAAAAYPERLASLPYEELRERMIESPDWTRDLGHAYRWQQTDVWRAVNALRLRAGSNGQPAVAVEQVAPHVHWRPWRPRQVIVVTRSNPNGPPSPAAQMQQGHRPSVAAQMQQQQWEKRQPVVQKKHEHREDRPRRHHHHGRTAP